MRFYICIIRKQTGQKTNVTQIAYYQARIELILSNTQK